MTARQHPAQAKIAPFADAAARLNEIPGVGLFAAHTIIAGIGLDMNRFPAAGHLRSRAKPPHPEGIRRHEEGLELHWPRQPLPGRVLDEAAVAASKTTFLGERYRRIARCRGKKKAVVAVSRSPSWPSSDTCYLTPPPGYATSAPASTTPASSPAAKIATTSGSSKPSATASPSNPPPD